MKKLNRNYLSFLEWIGVFVPNPNRPKGYGYHGYRFHHGAPNPNIHAENPSFLHTYVGYQLLGTLRPFAKMGKDLMDMVRPYATVNKLINDFLLPIRGIANLLAGVISMVGGVMVLIPWAIVFPFTLPLYLFSYSRTMTAVPFLKKAVYPVSWLVEGAANIIRGVTQIVFTPLSLLFKIPFRGFLTATNKKKFLVEEKETIQELAIMANNEINKLKIAQSELNQDVESKKVLKKSDITDHKTNKPKRSTAVLLFEINRKYNKSLKTGYQSKTKQHYYQMQDDYKTIFDSFTDESGSQDAIEAVQQERIVNKDIQLAEKYLSHFLPNYVKDNNCRKKKYFIVGGLVQVKERKLITGSPTDKDIQITDQMIIDSIKSQNNNQGIYVFDNFEHAKLYADIHNNRENFKHGQLADYPPIIEVTLFNDKEALKDLSDQEKIRTAYLLDDKTGQLALAQEQKQVRGTNINNIAHISRYCYEKSNAQKNVPERVVKSTDIYFQETKDDEVLDKLKCRYRPT